MRQPLKRRVLVAHPRESGYGLVELLIAVTVSGVVAGAVFTAMAAQNRGYSQVQELGDVHGTLRSSTGLLSWELRYASASQGDLYAIGNNSITLRVFRGSAIICSKDPGGWYGLTRMEGDRPFGSDSVLVFAAGTVGTFDDDWRSIDLTTLNAPSGATCEWSPPLTIDARLHVTVASPADTAGVHVGSPVYSFDAVSYAPFQWNGRWWFGRRMGTNPWEPLAGPLASSSGFQLTYYDAAGAVTTVPGQVAAVEVLLRGASTRKVDAVRGTEQDSVRVKVHLRS
ncbi:MAG: PilW family protein [Gemmatimonadota bacterium]